MGGGNGQRPDERPDEAATLAFELGVMAARDQQMRRRGVHDPKVDQQNLSRLKEIVAEIGWPTISKAGRGGSQCAWLLVQHADADPEFQRHCLELMHEAGSDVDIQNVAYLEDRVRINDGRPQLYGTQFVLDDAGNLAPLPIEDAENVDIRRNQVGLPPLAEYEQDLRRMQHPEEAP